MAAVSRGVSKGALGWRAGWRATCVVPGQMTYELGAAYRNRTDDLRITRGMRVRRSAATCINSMSNYA